MRQFTLKKRKASHKDYIHPKALGVANVVLPDELLFLTPVIDQKNSEHCTAYGGVEIRHSQTAVAYDPELFWNEEANLYGEGKDSSGGVTIETCGAVGVSRGFTPIGSTVLQNKASCYLWVHPFGFASDLFDAVRQTINHIQAPLGGGLDWYGSFDTPDGIVPNVFNQLYGGHFVKIAGFTKKYGFDVIVIQNSWSTSVGDNGLFYFSRDIFNKCFGGDYGIFYWSDNKDLQVVRLGFINALLVNLVNLMRKLNFIK